MEINRVNIATRAKLALALMDEGLTDQQIRTLVGLINAGDIAGAFIGLGKLLRRREKEAKANDTIPTD